MSNKTMMGVTLAVAAFAFAAVPTASFAKHKVECYNAKGAKDGAPMMMTAKQCKKAGGTVNKPADAAAPAAPATTETPAS